MSTVSPLDRLRWVDSVMCAQLPLTACRLAGHLAYIASSGSSWQSRASIADHLGIPERNLAAAFASLAAAGLLLDAGIHGPIGRQVHRWDLVIVPVDKESGGESVSPPDIKSPPPRESVSPHPVNPRHPPSKEGRKEGVMGGRRATPPPIDNSQRKIRDPVRRCIQSLSLPCSDSALEEWRELTWGRIGCKTVAMMAETIKAMVEDARDSGVIVKYSKDIPLDIVEAARVAMEKPT